MDQIFLISFGLKLFSAGAVMLVVTFAAYLIGVLVLNIDARMQKVLQILLWIFAFVVAAGGLLMIIASRF